MLFVPEELRQSPAAKALREQYAGAKGYIAALRKDRRRLRIHLMVGGIALVAFVAAVAWLMGGRYASTDNAYVRAAKLMVSTDVSGIVTEVNVKEGQYVKAGDVLFQVDPTQFGIALDNAKAQLAQTVLNIQSMKQDYRRIQSDIASQQAQVELAQVNFDRADALAKTGSGSRATYDQTRFALETAKKQLQALNDQAKVQLARLGGNPDIAPEDHPTYKQVKAQVDEAQRQLDHATVRAPFNGIATQVAALQPGAYLVAQTAALTNTGAIGLVSTDDVWVEANMKETDLTFVKVGNQVDVTIDTYPDYVWTGTVESISPASGAEFSLLPAQNSSGNWVKVVQRITVKIRLERQPNDPPLRSGMSAFVDIDTKHRRWAMGLF
ncbi:MAG TPA: HlyD family secretion protein [Xanthobacteraceae bacterium]|nr:HlyD family secretion protein [Xanthobacteraceae bacterium]